ncbi:lamin tail domain-containing protein [Winogradskyella sp. F6397]|uniref:Lamin tail domain-containing protein n=1 Tax=Winogradskyella marina TaxID=2785530 RepID=A0ABS0EE47_9FLAO|nr:lamin tail domain-containing protein [Winogradskyella marina]MBF8148518.1 lamin tail domain-containing protein [Winogradskyella marina]
MKHIYLLFITLFIGSLGYSQIISQYVETNSGTTPKGIEIWNNTGATLDFSSNSLVIEKGTNGGSPSTDFTLSTGTLASGDVIVIGTSDMETVTLANGGVFHEKSFTFNGDDALVVKYGGSITDMFGVAGSDPGSSWTGGGVDTKNSNIELNSGITTGDTDGWTDPSTRFSTLNSNPSGTNGGEGFGISPTLPPSCTAPTTAATAFTESSVTTNSATLSWTGGDGDNVIVLMKEGAAVDFTPISGTDYNDEAAFGSSTELETGNYVVYNGSGTSVDVTGLTQNETYHVAVYEYNDTETCYMGTALTGDFDTLASTKIQFSATSATVDESAGSYDLVIEIANEDVAATTFDVVLTSGDAADIDSYTTQSETFPGSSTTDITVTITITDDAIIETDEVLTFEIQNVAGGNNAAVGTNNTFDLTITNNDFPTTVEFVSSSDTASEGDGTYDLELTIANEDAAATSFDVVLTGGTGDASDINSYTTQTVIFPGGTSANQTITLTITDDSDLEVDETLTFEIQNVTGGNNAIVGINTTFSLTITNNDVAPPITLPYSEDFSDCGTAEWTAFDEAGNDEWICSGGEYAINGYSGTDDTDWLISDFSIDFDAYATVNIDVTTQEQYGDTTNTPGEFELLYSTDYTGGDPTTATWTALSFDPNNTSSYGSLSPVSVTSVDASSITGTAYLAFKYDMNFGGGAEDWHIQNIDIYEVSSSTTVEFVSASATVGEAIGTYDLEFAITNEDAVNDTTFDVVLTGGTGSAADIDSYTTQTVTFVGGTTANQTVTITVTDDALDEGDETLIFEIQNVAGGDAAAVGLVDSFELTILASDSVTPLEGDIVISEIMYNSSGTDDEWIEIYNASGSDITLDSDWEFNYDFNSYDFNGTVITAGSYLTIAFGSNGDGTFNNDNPFTPDVTTFATPATIANIDNTNNVGNSSETISIVYDPNGADITIDTVTYDDGSPWPTTPDGNGPSLELPDLTSDNSLGANWEASEVAGGTPGFGRPITYTYNGTWSPSDPNGTATANDDIIIASGDAIISTNTTANSVTVNPGAAITVDELATLTVSNGLVLESTSSSFSSLILDGTITGTTTYERFANGYNNGAGGGNDLIAPPLSGQSWSDFLTTATNSTDLLDNGATSPTTYAFAPFDKTASAYVNYTDATSATLNTGTGYRVATDSGANLTFTGTAADANVTITIENSGSSYASWNLIGNPYPSYLDMEAFLAYANVPEQRNIDVIGDATGIYGYDGTTSGWTTYTLSNATGELIAPGQGFFVASDAASADLYFTTEMRTTGSSDDFIAGRNATNELTYLKLKASTTNQSYNTDFYFNTNSSSGLDLGYDAKIWGGTAPSFALYSHLVEDNTGLPIALQSLNTTDLSEVSIPLGVHANQGEQLTFSIAESTLENNVNVYLDDTVANTSTLLNGEDYVLTPNSELSGTGRFYLRTTETTLSTIDNHFDHLNIYINKADKTIVIAGQLLTPTTMKLYDMQGRTVSHIILDNTRGSMHSIDVSNLNAGVYVVQLDNGTQLKTQKIIIN